MGYWQMVVDMNEHQKSAFTSKIISSLFNTVTNKKFHFCNSPVEAVEGAHALVVLTEWDEFKVYPYEEFYAKMMKPACVFDGRGILNHRGLEDIGFEVHAIGKGRGADGRLNVLAQAQ